MLAAASNVGVMSAADFVAGFLYGMTTENHLTEIEACFQGGELMVSEIEAGVADFKKGGWDNDVQGILEFGLAILQIPQALGTCRGMDEDMAAIKTWASIFKDPARLAATISKHMLFHKSDIEADIKTVETDWSSAKYFQSGVDLADLMILAIGPITPATPAVSLLEMPPVDPFVPDFTAGLIHGFTGNDHRAELEGCMTNLEPIADDLMAILNDAKSMHFLKIANDLGNIIWMLPDAVSSCEQLTQLQADIQVMTDWAEVLKQPTKVARVASKNWLFHGVQIKADITEGQADYAAGDYYGAGDETAKVALGLVPLDTANYLALPPVDPFVPDFTAGLLFGFTGNDHRAELEGCMTNLEPLEKDIMAALGDIKHFHLMKFAEDVGNFIWMLPEAVSSCDKLTELQADIDVVVDWASMLKHPLKVSKIASKNWLFHGIKIKKEIDQEQAAWASGDYYTAGSETAAVLTGLLPEDADVDKLVLEYMLN